MTSWLNPVRAETRSGAIGFEELLQLVEPGGVRRDVIAIDQVVVNQDVRDAVEQRQIRARLERQMKIGHHRCLGDARVGHDQRLVPVRFQILAEDRMIVGKVGADQQHHIGNLHVFVIARRPVAAERELVTGDGRGHAERGVAVVVARAETKLHELAERVELFGDKLARAQHTE